MLVGKAFTSDKYDLDSSTLAAPPAAPFTDRSAKSVVNMGVTRITVERSLPSASTGKLATMVSLLAESTAICTALPPARLA